VNAPVIIVSNAIDDNTRLDRSIITDSPAASRKVFLLARSLKINKINVSVISLGRGRAGLGLRFYPKIQKQVEGICVEYLPYSTLRFASELISVFALVSSLLRRRRTEKAVIIFYNKLVLYAPAVFVSWSIRNKNILDLEDGFLPNKALTPSQIYAQISSVFYDKFCGQGVLLACNALQKQTKIQHKMCYYGSVECKDGARKFDNPVIAILYGGTISPETGSEIFIEAVKIIQESSEEWCKSIQFYVTGHGTGILSIKNELSATARPLARVLGRLNQSEYSSVLNLADIGLALKPNRGGLAETTFPSKVIEYASNGLLVLSTDVSDVRNIFGENAVYLERDCGKLLVEKLKNIVLNQIIYKKIARQSQILIERRFSIQNSGAELKKFLLLK
jgi:glycosyltransferase involved in cell wall biosynthesis